MLQKYPLSSRIVNERRDYIVPLWDGGIGI